MGPAPRIVSPFVIAGLLLVCPADARAQSVRPLDRLADTAYVLGQRRSEQFRQLVAELDASDVIVHVVTTQEMPPGIVGTMRFVALIEGVRYVRVHLSSTLAPKLRAAMLAHELQHACELARSSAASTESVRALYAAIGKAAWGLEHEFETAEAEEMGWTVWAELGGNLRASPGEP